ncbi:MAG: glycosyltransferase [Saprospiraceae bacterium]|nr:glycosyltransferase [Saprospiraceae bacterium]
MGKIIIIGPAYPLRGGLATFNERLARQFMAEGHDVTLYTFSLQYPDFLFPGKTQYSESPPPTDLRIKVCINSVNPLNWWSVGQKIKKEKADFVLVRYWLPFMGPCLGSIIRIIKKNGISKIIALVDNALPHEKRPGDFQFTKYFTAAVDGFITMSEYVKNDLKQFTRRKVTLVQHPLYDNFGPRHPKLQARKTLGLPTDGFIFLFFGFIRKYKGLDMLISAMDYLSKTENIYLLIAGEYYAGEEEIKSQIKNSASKLKIIEHTHFIKDEDVGLYFSASDCVVQPYRNATQSGVTPLAYHFEVPMIVTNVGALPDLVPHSIGLVCAPDPASIAHCMQEMLSFDFISYRTAIIEEKKKLSWEKLTSSIWETCNN